MVEVIEYFDEMGGKEIFNLFIHKFFGKESTF